MTAGNSLKYKKFYVPPRVFVVSLVATGTSESCVQEECLVYVICSTRLCLRLR